MEIYQIVLFLFLFHILNFDLSYFRAFYNNVINKNIYIFQIHVFNVLHTFSTIKKQLGHLCYK